VTYCGAAVVMDLDLVVAVLTPRVFFGAMHQRMLGLKSTKAIDSHLVPGSSSLLQYCMNEVDQSKTLGLGERTIKALTGPQCVARICETLQDRKVGVAAFGALIESLSCHLARLSLRFQAFQGLKTFQIALLIEELVKSPKFTGQMSFEAFSTFIRCELSPEKFLNIMEGVYHDNSDNFATCNMAYHTRLLQAFLDSSPEFDFEREKAGANTYRCEIHAENLWKASILFSAGFPAVMRQVQQHAPDSFFVGNFVVEDQPGRTIQAEFAACFGQNATQEDNLMKQSLSLLVLPPGSYLKLYSNSKVIMQKSFY
jgi:hypothetical protein